VSRSRYVWVIIDGEQLKPIAAFTVKHECALWLERHGHPFVGVCRITDNRSADHDVVWLNPRDLEPAA